LNNFVGKRAVTAFVSDACNTMRVVRQLLVENETVDFAYGCASHAFHNVCESIAKTEAVKESIQCSVFVATSIKNNKALRHIYKTLSTELLAKKYTVLLYSSSRWGICSVIRALESNFATMATAYACFLTVRLHREGSASETLDEFLQYCPDESRAPAGVTRLMHILAKRPAP